jgi:coenzyme PQQ precursor peptide PqqA
MMPPILGNPRWEEHGARTKYRSIKMKWETPQAVELRFGMEITMYVSNR